MPLSRSEKEGIRGWLQMRAAGDDEFAAGYAARCLQWLAELGSPFEQKVDVVDRRDPGPVVNPTPKDTMIQIRFRAKRSTVSISELPDETQD